MLLKNRLISLLILFIAPIVIISCGGNGSSGKAPAVVVEPGTSGTTDGTTTVVVIKSDDGDLGINGETITSDQYNPAKNGSSTITVTDENGKAIIATVDDEGNIRIAPVDGSVEGIYTVVIVTGGREYDITVTVSADGLVTVTNSTSHPVGTSMVLDLESGRALIKTDDSIVISSKDEKGVFALDSSIHSLTVTDRNGHAVAAVVDPVTGDIIVSGSASAPYTIVIDTGSRIITIVTDENGKIKSVSEDGKKLVLDCTNGMVFSNSITLILTASDGSSYSFATGVSVISATAGGGAIAIAPSAIQVDRTNGDIYVVSDDAAPAGPYELKVSVNGKKYVIRTDETGKVTGILPGNVLLELSQGNIVYCGRNVLAFADRANGFWAFSGGISSLEVKDKTGTAIDIAANVDNGNIVTSDSFSDPVTMTFKYRNSAADLISYRIVIVNGSVSEFWAEVSEPGPNFDFSTVTNVSITLKVVDEKTGFPIGQASISLVNSAGTGTWEGFTGNDGLSIFAATVDAAGKTTKIVVTKQGYESVECAITGIGKLIEFGKRIAMKPVESVTISDRDGDGIADDEDDYPDDATAAKKITGEYTLAFEDMYPSKGDADFNDLVVKLVITERIDGQNKLRRIDLKTKLLASGAGYVNKFAINIYGKRYVLIENPKAVSDYTLGYYYYTQNGKRKLGSYSNTSGSYHECAEQIHAPIIFDKGIERKSMVPMPYDPFIICNGVEGNEVHLSFVTTSFTGITLDADGFPWGIVVPADWAWPYESGSIFNAYGEFDDWYTHQGTRSQDWYLRPSSDYIYHK